MVFRYRFCNTCFKQGITKFFIVTFLFIITKYFVQIRYWFWTNFLKRWFIQPVMALNKLNSNIYITPWNARHLTNASVNNIRSGLYFGNAIHLHQSLRQMCPYWLYWQSCAVRCKLNFVFYRGKLGLWINHE